MKVYQEIWLDKLIEADNAGYRRLSGGTQVDIVKKVCEDILDDDTGGTDELVMKLAEIVLEYLPEDK